MLLKGGSWFDTLFITVIVTNCDVLNEGSLIIYNKTVIRSDNLRFNR